MTPSNILHATNSYQHIDVENVHHFHIKRTHVQLRATWSEITLNYWMMVEDTHISRKRLAVRSPIVKSPLYLKKTCQVCQLPRVLWRRPAGLLSHKKTIKKKPKTSCHFHERWRALEWSYPNNVIGRRTGPTLLC